MQKMIVANGDPKSYVNNFSFNFVRFHEKFRLIFKILKKAKTNFLAKRFPNRERSNH